MPAMLKFAPNIVVTISISLSMMMGPALLEEHRADAIRPFVRLEESRNKATGGTGLGLAIANDIILGHGGELSFDDAPLGGLRVTVTLPV